MVTLKVVQSRVMWTKNATFTVHNLMWTPLSKDEEVGGVLSYSVLSHRRMNACSYSKEGLEVPHFSLQVCMCSEELCNDEEYDLHSDRARRLFTNLTGSNSNNNVQRLRSNNKAGKQSSVLGWKRPDEGKEEKVEEVEKEQQEVIYYTEEPRDLEWQQQRGRVPRQLREGKQHADAEQLVYPLYQPIAPASKTVP